MVVARRTSLPLVVAMLAQIMAAGSCRRPALPRGDSAVVVLSRRMDAAGPPSVIEQEPNDSPEQAQLLNINPDWPVLSVDGSLSGPGEGKGKDVDVFKLLIPGPIHDSPKTTANTDSSAASEDYRIAARRLGLEVSPTGGGLSVQVLDDGLKSMESVVAESGATEGVPNLAVAPGHAYYIRLKALNKAGKGTDTPAVGCTYRLTVQLGDFEVADEREPNDSMETAFPQVVVGSAEVSGFFGWTHDQDFFRIPAPDVASVLDVDLDGVEGVGAGLMVLDGSGGRLATGKGRKGERLALHNVLIPVGGLDAGSSARWFYVVARAESGHNRGQRYVLHLTLGMPKQDTEIEPNDQVTAATPVRDGTISGFLPVGDVDCFRYDAEGGREISVEVSFPSRVRGKLEIIRPSDGQVLAFAEAKKPRQTLSVARVATTREPLVIRLSQAKGDGNATDPYSLRVRSNSVTTQDSGPRNSPSPLNPE